jgi:thiamine-phosphate diphosphorylase
VTSSAEREVGRELPRLHVVTDDQVLTRDDWPDVRAAVLEAGRARIALHLRGPGLGGRVLHDHVAGVAGAAGKGAMVLVNDRVDVALSLPVDGVQLRESSLSVADARRLLGDERWIGASVHGPERARGAEEEGADYLVVGTLFATPTHPGRPGRGTDLLAEVIASCELPLVGIGGVTPRRAAELKRLGAYGIAVLGGIWKSSDPAAAVLEYLEAIEG